MGGFQFHGTSVPPLLARAGMEPVLHTKPLLKRKGLYKLTMYTDWRKVRIGEHVLAFPGQFLFIVEGVGKPEGRDGTKTKVYLRKVDSGARVVARVTQLSRPRWVKSSN